MIETEKDYEQALDRVDNLMEDPRDHRRVLEKLVEEIDIYEAKIAREDKLLCKIKNHYCYEKKDRLTLEELEKKVVCWAEDRDLYMQSTPDTRFGKIEEEVGELREAYQDLEVEDVCMEAGDVIVTLINFLQPLGLDLRVCLQAAYDKIKNRQGEMINGTFVKNEG